MKHIIAALVAFGIIGAADATETMNIRINDTDYTVELESSHTVDDIVAQLPLRLELVRFDGHEYYDTLPFRPRADAPTESRLRAGHIYYWPGGNSFVINFIDYDISPYANIHLGRITDAGAVDFLRDAGPRVSVVINK